MIHMHDWSLTVVPASMSTNAVDLSLRQHLRIEQFRHRVSQALGSNVSGTFALPSRERMSLYRLLDASLIEIERDVSGSSSTIDWYFAAARLHLQAFYLLDDSSTEGYNERILTLFQTACNFIELSQELDSSNGGDGTLFAYLPFFSYQVFVCAAFVVLKILDNGFFRTMADADGGRKLMDSAIVRLRAISVVNNDLPARLGDVIGFFCALPDQGALGGETADDLRLREVKNRLSMSVVYDSLWIWRKQFRTGDSATQGERPQTLEDEYLAALCW